MPRKCHRYLKFDLWGQNLNIKCLQLHLKIQVIVTGKVLTMWSDGTCCGNHFTVYMYMKSLRRTPWAHTVLYVNYILTKLEKLIKWKKKEFKWMLMKMYHVRFFKNITFPVWKGVEDRHCGERQDKGAVIT